MTLNQLIAIAAIVVPSGTALLVAYWHRKQLRQIEEFRGDPAVGLHPPANPVWAWIKRKRDLLALAGGFGIPLFYELSRSEPVTRWTVFLIALDFACMVLVIVLALVGLIYQTLSKLVDA